MRIVVPPGCGRYTVALRERPAIGEVIGPAIVNNLPWDSIVWEERLDTSSASGFLSIPACSDDFSIKTRCQELAIKRNGELVFIGPIVEAKRNPVKGNWEIKARDRSWWWLQDGVHSDFSGELDYATVFLKLVKDLEGEYNYSGLLPSVVAPDFGADVGHGSDVVYREWKETDDPDPDSQIRELADSGIDYTVHGAKLFVRGTSGLLTTGGFSAPITIRDNEIAGYVWAEEDGKELANCVVVKSSYEVTVPPPPDAPSGTEPTKDTIEVRVQYPEPCIPEGCEGIRKIVVDLEGLNESAALSAAKTRWESRHVVASYLTMEDRSSGDEGTLGGYLLPSSTFDVAGSICGTLVNFTTRFPSGVRTETLRLSEKEIEVRKEDGGGVQEQVRIGLQPLGKV